jgi:hypothetical protein
MVLRRPQAWDSAADLLSVVCQMRGIYGSHVKQLLLYVDRMCAALLDKGALTHRKMTASALQYLLRRRGCPPRICMRSGLVSHLFGALRAEDSSDVTSLVKIIYRAAGCASSCCQRCCCASGEHCSVSKAVTVC